MTGDQLARKILTPPVDILMEQHFREGSRERAEVGAFVTDFGLKLAAVAFRQEIRIDDAVELCRQDFPDDELIRVFHIALKSTLAQLGRYDWSDDLPWIAEAGCCSCCEPYWFGEVNTGGSRHICPVCYRRWLYDPTREHWNQATDYERWDLARQWAMFPQPTRER